MFGNSGGFGFNGRSVILLGIRLHNFGLMYLMECLPHAFNSRKGQRPNQKYRNLRVGSAGSANAMASLKKLNSERLTVRLG